MRPPGGDPMKVPGIPEGPSAGIARPASGGTRSLPSARGPSRGHAPCRAAPGPDQAGRRPRRRPAPPVEARFPRCVDEDEGDASIGGTHGRDPGVAQPRRLWAVPPGPGGQGHEGCPGDPTPIGPRADRPPRALHDHGPLQGRLDVSHQGRIPPPAIGHDQRGWQPLAPPLPDGPRPLQHDLQPRQLVAAGPARTHRVGAGAPQRLPGRPASRSQSPPPAGGHRSPAGRNAPGRSTRCPPAPAAGQTS